MATIENVDNSCYSHKMWSLDPSASLQKVRSLLPGVTDTGRTRDGKCTHQWFFRYDGHLCAIWDYRGVRWSGFGPRHVFEELGLLTPHTQQD